MKHTPFLARLHILTFFSLLLPCSWFSCKFGQCGQSQPHFCQDVMISWNFLSQIHYLVVFKFSLTQIQRTQTKCWWILCHNLMEMMPSIRGDKELSFAFKPLWAWLLFSTITSALGSLSPKIVSLVSRTSNLF